MAANMEMKRSRVRFMVVESSLSNLMAEGRSLADKYLSNWASALSIKVDIDNTDRCCGVGNEIVGQRRFDDCNDRLLWRPNDEGRQVNEHPLVIDDATHKIINDWAVDAAIPRLVLDVTTHLSRCAVSVMSSRITNYL